MNSNYIYDVIIVGGGIAGISAAYELSTLGQKCLLIEKSDDTLGRARAFHTEEFGLIDCGEHLFSGAYTNLFSLFKSLGTYDLLFRQKALSVDFLYQNGEIDRLRGSDIPVVSSAIGLLKLKKLSFAQKYSIAKAALKIKYTDKCAFDSVDLLLSELKQSKATLERFWIPLCLAVFNAELQNIDTSIFIRTIKQGFFNSNPSSNGLAYSKANISLLFEPFKKIFQSLGSEIIYSTKIVRIEESNKAIAKIISSDGREFFAKNFIFAVPINEFKNIYIHSELESLSFYKKFDFYSNSPIVSVYLEFDREISDIEFGGLINSPIHWIFNLKKMLIGEKRHLYAFTISAANSIFKMKNSEIIKLCLSELGKYLPNSLNAKILNARIFKNQNATSYIKAGNYESYIETETEIENLFLAGDWIKTGLPATMESACISGKLSADAILLKK